MELHGVKPGERQLLSVSVSCQWPAAPRGQKSPGHSMDMDKSSRKGLGSCLPRAGCGDGRGGSGWLSYPTSGSRNRCVDVTLRVGEEVSFQQHS